MSRIQRIYVAGPMSIGDAMRNLRAAIDAGNALADAGFSPFLPQTGYLWELVHPRSHRSWLEIDLSWVDVCDALLRLPGESKGADIEVGRATMKGKPVFYSVDDLLYSVRRWTAADDE